jgi:hypothetical protein
LTPSKPSACVQGDHSSERERESACGQLLIRSILVLLFSFEVPQKKNLSKKKLQKKAKRNKKSNNKEGALCVFLFLCAVVLCDYLYV